MNLLLRLQRWYGSYCDGDWEHTYGITIGTIDNPGWTLSVNIEDTDLEEAVYESVTVERSPEDWYQCFVREKIFEGAGGAGNLTDLISTFLEWAEPIEASRRPTGDNG